MNPFSKIVSATTDQAIWQSLSWYAWAKTHLFLRDVIDPVIVERVRDIHAEVLLAMTAETQDAIYLTATNLWL